MHASMGLLWGDAAQAAPEARGVGVRRAHKSGEVGGGRLLATRLHTRAEELDAQVFFL